MKHGATVPYLWKLEITNTLLVSEKRNRLHIADTVKFIDLYNSIPLNISNFNFSIHEIIQTARANNLTAYDTTYLLTAMH
ncbi:type II toxin-antitoxin system VapC family toxin [Rickettsia tamurae]|nr:type II toxin-antitoxin system VapC family toxin [Rickettsia tamurae]